MAEGDSAKGEDGKVGKVKFHVIPFGKSGARKKKVPVKGIGEARWGGRTTGWRKKGGERIKFHSPSLEIKIL